jgi:hypothetical protein
MDPWVFEGPESVQWIIEHPLPIFLCVVLVGGWTEGDAFELKAPILDVTIQDVLNSDSREQMTKVLKYWIDYDVENLFRIKSGIHHFRVPYQYETNSTDGSGGLGDMGGPFTDESLLRAENHLKELLGLVTTHHYSKGGLDHAVIYAMALRKLCPVEQPYTMNPHDMQLHTELNARLGLTSYVYHACDTLLKEAKNKLPRLPLSDDEHKSAAIGLFAKGWALTHGDAEVRWPTLHPNIQKHFLDAAEANAPT